MSAADSLAVAVIPARLARAMERRTFPRYRPLLAQAGVDPCVVALGLLDGGDAVGMLLGRIEGARATVLSVSVAADHRRRGGGLALLRAFETDATLRGAAHASTRFTGARGVLCPFREVLRVAGWRDPTLCSVIYTMDRERSLEAPWFTRAQARLGRLTIQPWREAAPDALRLVGSADWAHAELHPRNHVGVGQDGAPQDLDASALLRAGPEADAPVEGWIIVHRITGCEARVTATAVRPDRERGFAYGALVAHANRTLYAAGVERASFMVRPYETRHARFIERRIAPLVEEVRESWECVRTLRRAASHAIH